MRKHWILLLLIGLLSVGKAQATHIVGGEIELEYVDGNSYILRLILYFDNWYGNPEAQDNAASVYIFSKANRQFINVYDLPLVEESFVPYTNPACFIPQLSTKKLVYETEVALSPSEYSEEEGYYAVWERCCRNLVIDNLIVPDETGQTFLLEFPPVVKEEEPFVNSSPSLFPPLADYACINRPFFFDFAGTDPDGDSLVYSLAHPLNSSRFEPLPTPTPPPHPLVNFVGGLDGENPIPAEPGKELKITPDGFLTITPTTAGLYVFSIKVEEYRDGVRLGEVNRDFQMLVRDDCIIAYPPSITATEPGGGTYTEGDTVVIPLSADRCFSVYIKDEEFLEGVSVRVKPVNFNTDENLQAIMSPTSGTVSANLDSLEVQVCLPECSYNEDGLYILDFIAYDDACAKPLTDTLRMTIFAPPPANEEPVLTSNQPADTIIANFGGRLNITLTGTDGDNDPLNLYLLDPPYDFDQVMMEWTDANGVGTVNSTFSWNLDCDLLRLGTQDIYELTFVVEDEDYCQRVTADTLVKIIKVIPPANIDPVLSTQVIEGESTLEDGLLVVEVGSSLRLRAMAQDGNNDVITLSLVNATDSLLRLFDFAFADVTGQGTVSGDLVWTAQCNYLQPGQRELGPIELEFAVVDEFCLFPASDTLVVNLLARDREEPTLTGQIPTIFTPNGDDFNEQFDIPMLPIGNCFGQFDKVTIFSRWGDTVFESDQIDFIWDGLNVPNGVYYWVVTYTNGASFKGFVTVFR